MCNTEIKKEMRDRGVRQWQIAEYIGVSEGVLSRKMRHDLEPDLRSQVVEAIDALGSPGGTCKIGSGIPGVVNK